MGRLQAIFCREVLGTLIAAVFVILASDHAQAIRWLALQTQGWNTTAECRQARLAGELSRRQTRLCRSSLDTMVQVTRAASSTVAVCQDLLQDRRWNCSSIQLAPHFTPDLTTGTREQAFVQALSSAAVTHAVARACAAGLLAHCACASPPTDPPDGAFKWGGCGDNLRWAAHFSRQFVDSADKHRPGRRYRERLRLANISVDEGDRELALVNLHNNRAGRRAVESSVQAQCKCHGVSGSCSVRTCWKALPPRLFEVGVRLLRLYPRAVEVRANPAVGRRLLPARPTRYSQDDLVYVAKSPDYCHRDYRVGSVGTYGRMCNNSVEGHLNCANMCCGRGYETRTVEKVERCHCKYYWCCYVKCKTCRSWVNINRCN
ncbi:protein Wnt-11b-2-like [Homalodisca vitripennis]|uniref:protein Wnt-11b-2-like n=1 Tax=Homalodisca vitripennis TaxID=197043 RepID=UPI001EECB684|nr:protein Wnt-11b-2-like [Homalodisca vitripennis]